MSEVTKLAVGIDPGVKTGVATMNLGTKRLVSLRTMGIVDAFEFLRGLQAGGQLSLVLFEDARMRSGGFGGTDAATKRSGAGVREGVGSVKRDCSIWAEWLTKRYIAHRPIAPEQCVTKLDARAFLLATGWADKTSQHARDAAMLVLAHGATAMPSKGSCKACGHQVLDHMPKTGRCPAGPRTAAGFFTRYGSQKFTM
jgi:hypothetical protein